MIIKTARYYLILLCSVTVSCEEKNCGFQATRTILNSTSHDLEIRLFYENVETDSFVILANSSDSRDFNCYLTFCTLVRTSCQEPLWSYERDSSVVIFGNERYISYCSNSLDCQVNSKNILGLNVYTSGSGYVMTEEKTFVFEITEEDYNTATIIE